LTRGAPGAETWIMGVSRRCPGGRRS
jgi:hypothetical protein